MTSCLHEQVNAGRRGRCTRHIRGKSAIAGCDGPGRPRFWSIVLCRTCPPSGVKPRLIIQSSIERHNVVAVGPAVGIHLLEIVNYGIIQVDGAPLNTITVWPSLNKRRRRGCGDQPTNTRALKPTLGHSIQRHKWQFITYSIHRRLYIPP